MFNLAACDELRAVMGNIEKAMLEGFDAGEKLRALESNPYRLETSEHWAWCDGWKLGGKYSDLPQAEQLPL